MRSISSPSLLPVGGGRLSVVGCAPGWSVSSGFWPEEALSECAARLPRVSKSSLLPLRALLVPRGALLLAFAVKVSTCFAREAARAVGMFAKRAKREHRGLISEFAFEREQQLLSRGGFVISPLTPPLRFRDVLAEIVDLIRISGSLASLSVLAAVDPCLLLGQLLLFYPIEVFFFLGHGFFDGRVLPSGLASRSSWVDVKTVEVEGSPQLAVHLAGAFHQGFGLRKPCPCVQLDFPEFQNQVLLPLQALVVPHGTLLLSFAVKVSTCFAREATSFLLEFISVGIDGSPVVRLRVFVSIGRHIGLSVCGYERDRSVPSPPSSAKLWEPKFCWATHNKINMKDSKAINRKRAKREQRGLISEFAFEGEQQNIGVVSTDPKTELRKLRTKMHGYRMGSGSEWYMENWPRSPGEPIRGTIERADRQHGRAHRASWLVSRPSSPASRSATRPLVRILILRTPHMK
ncbi:hypothetical protein DY000_02015855 [Brassica cretica]|uniref:Uncharacterized protein n=1 Tax=Brassica cretica TaxID=69181 RepID=A0ABQ7D1E7_BRACR|nr:hypothetical protein DY000_02015855 [Brassica cretica]